MAEVEPARYRLTPREVVVDQLVERHQSLRVAQACGCHGKVELEGVAGDRRRLGETTGRSGEGVQLTDDRMGYGVGHAGALLTGILARAVLAEARQLEQVERVAAAGLVEPLPFRRGHGADQGPSQPRA